MQNPTSILNSSIVVPKRRQGHGHFASGHNNRLRGFTMTIKGSCICKCLVLFCLHSC